MAILLCCTFDKSVGCCRVLCLLEDTKAPWTTIHITVCSYCQQKIVSNEQRCYQMNTGSPLITQVHVTSLLGAEVWDAAQHQRHRWQSQLHCPLQSTEKKRWDNTCQMSKAWYFHNESWFGEGRNCQGQFSPSIDIHILASITLVYLHNKTSWIERHFLPNINWHWIKGWHWWFLNMAQINILHLTNTCLKF